MSCTMKSEMDDKYPSLPNHYKKNYINFKYAQQLFETNVISTQVGLKYLSVTLLFQLLITKKFSYIRSHSVTLG